MLRTLGEWVSKLRHMTTQVRAQTGIDEILPQEGIDGGISELRNLIRGDLAELSRARSRAPELPEAPNPYEEAVELDRYREYPPEGVDAAGALPDDLVDDEPAVAPAPEPSATPAAPADDVPGRGGS